MATMYVLVGRSAPVPGPRSPYKKRDEGVIKHLRLMLRGLYECVSFRGVLSLVDQLLTAFGQGGGHHLLAGIVGQGTRPNQTLAAQLLQPLRHLI